MRKKGYSPQTAAPKEGQGNACAPGHASPTRSGEQPTAQAERYSPESLPPRPRTEREAVAANKAAWIIEGNRGNAKFFQPKEMTMALQAKLAGIVVHTEEFLSTDGHVVDKAALDSLLNDSEVQAWIKSLGPFAPVKRSKR